jgi:hypothetical protein
MFVSCDCILVNINLIISFHQCHISLMVFAWTYLCLWCQSVTFLEGCFVFYSIYLCAIDLARKAPLQQSAKKGKTLVIEGKASLQCLRGVIQLGPIGSFFGSHKLLKPLGKFGHFKKSLKNTLPSLSRTLTRGISGIRKSNEKDLKKVSQI